MNEADARRVLLLRALETAAPDGPLWTAEDREWATRAARDALGTEAPAEDWLAGRARIAMQRLAPRDATLARRAAPAARVARAVALAVACALALGVAADAIGPTQRINLLAPPVWAVVAWNLLVYLWLALAAVARRGAAPPGGPLRAWIARWWAPAPWPARWPTGGGAAAARIEVDAAFGALWSRHALPIAGARAAAVLHAAAAALAAGLAAGLYLRGLVLDYRAGWQSTFLDAATVHAVLAAAFAPASALTGIAVPDAATVEALRVLPAAPGGPEAGAGGGANAAPWIHLYAATLAVAVVLPRTLLAAWQGARARRLAATIELPIAEPYYQALLRAQRGHAAGVIVLPHAAAPSAQAALGLRSLLAGVFGESVQLRIGAPVAFGHEEEATVPAPSDAAAALALFDLAATPEAEQHGRMMQALARTAGATPLVMLLDEAAFVRRFGARSERHQQRRAAWRHFAETRGWPIVFADLDAPDPARARAALEAAIGAAAGSATASSAIETPPARR